jgi:TP901 family phage tail tape measure protein
MNEAEIERMVVRLIGDTIHYQKSLDKAATKTKSWATKVSGYVNKVASKFKSLGSSVRSVGRSMTMRLTAPIAALGIGSVVLAGGFEAEMQKVVGLVGVAQSQVDEWSNDILKLAPTLGKAPRELAEAMFFVTSAGLRGKTALDALVMSAKASAGGLGETAVIADAVTSAMNAYGAENMSASLAVDVLTAAVREGKLAAEELAPVLGRVLPMASKLGVAFSDVAGYMAVMSRTGSSAAEGSTSVQALLMTLMKPEQGAIKALEDVGLTFQELRDMVKKPGGIIDVMKLLDEKFRGNDEGLASIIPNVRALRGVMNVLAQDSSIVDSVMGGVQDAVGSAEKAFRVATNTIKWKFNAAMAAAKSLMIQLGKDAMPLVTAGLKAFTTGAMNFITFWQDLSPTVKWATFAVLGFAAVLGPLLVIGGGIISMIGFMISGLSAIIAILPVIGPALAVVGVGLLALAGIAYYFRKEIGEALDFYKDALDGMANAIRAGDVELAWEIMTLQIKLTFMAAILEMEKALFGLLNALALVSPLAARTRDKLAMSLVSGGIALLGTKMKLNEANIEAYEAVLQQMYAEEAVEEAKKALEEAAKNSNQMAALGLPGTAPLQDIEGAVMGTAEAQSRIANHMISVSGRFGGEGSTQERTAVATEAMQEMMAQFLETSQGGLGPAGLATGG